MKITKKHADEIDTKLLFAAGCLRVVAQASDAQIRNARLKEAEDAIADVMEIVDDIRGKPKQ